jgi:hypothetical protein
MDSQESISPPYVAWQTGTTSRPARQAGNRFLGFSKGLQIRGLVVLSSLCYFPVLLQCARFFFTDHCNFCETEIQVRLSAVIVLLVFTTSQRQLS